MDALLLIDTDDASYPSDDAMETLGDIVTRTRAVGGVLIFASTKADLADTPDGELSIFVPDEEDLVLRSESPDVFEGVDDLAAGLHDLSVDRIIIAGADATTGVPGVDATTGVPGAGAGQVTADPAAQAGGDADADVSSAGTPEPSTPRRWRVLCATSTLSSSPTPPLTPMATSSSGAMLPLMPVPWSRRPPIPGCGCRLCRLPEIVLH